ncbi:hypothetical protein [Alkalibacterium thalassium]|uniref:Uncharacterized protein n=1 Tax=Alkalibacterium thalassium TaxID=426701 RepID=A0A1G9DTM5_9LACT|nr:hypothetical protein [Alkalibacterium thalassium]SDK67231.1 hypothetical protein SAMN04488098_104914 [Alkalibacterium thalassium]
MGFLIVWIVQLFIFFVIVSSVASLFSKTAKKTAQNPEARESSDKIEASKRNLLNEKRQNSRPGRVQRERRPERERYDRRKNSEPIIKDVVSLSSSKNRKKRPRSATDFDKRQLKQAIIYKEILDKPLSLREID